MIEFFGKYEASPGVYHITLGGMESHLIDTSEMSLEKVSYIQYCLNAAFNDGMKTYKEYIDIMDKFWRINKTPEFPKVAYHVSEKSPGLWYVKDKIFPIPYDEFCETSLCVAEKFRKILKRIHMNGYMLQKNSDYYE